MRGIALKTEIQKTKFNFLSSPSNIHLQKKKGKEKIINNKYNENKK